VNVVNEELYDDEVGHTNFPKGYTLLVKGEYDVNNEEDKTIQTIPVPVAIRRLNLPVELVVFTVTSNWGNQEYTCLYRVRVHGHTLSSSSEEETKVLGDDRV